MPPISITSPHRNSTANGRLSSQSGKLPIEGNNMIANRSRSDIGNEKIEGTRLHANAVRRLR